MVPKNITSACWPGLRRFPHSSHLKHSGCQSYPKDCLRSAAKNKTRTLLIITIYYAVK